MLNRKEAKADVGVIVGRFQVHRPHEAHIILIKSVMARHDKVIIFLGLSPLRNTYNNPLDFRNRKAMLYEHFKDKVDVYYIDDDSSDDVWSNNLDKQIKKWLSPTQTALLYGSRDSFLERYTTGTYHVCELESSEMISGTEIRRKIINDYKSTEAFRAGIIAATGQRFPTVYTTVDVVILDEKKKNMLLAQKPNEEKWRLIGGFAETKSDSFETDIKREAAGEANIEIGDIRYLGSARIDDWRHKSEIDCVKTLLFSAKYIHGRVEGGDDIARVKWHPIDNLYTRLTHGCLGEIIIEEHWILIQKFFSKFIPKKA